MKQPFPDGTYFTGKDRECFPRSLYEYISFNKKIKKHKIRHLFLSGLRTNPEWHVFEWDADVPFFNEYRPATVEEINSYFETYGCEPPTFYKDHYGGMYAKNSTNADGSWKKI